MNKKVNTWPRATADSTSGSALRRYQQLRAGLRSLSLEAEHKRLQAAKVSRGDCRCHPIVGCSLRGNEHAELENRNVTHWPAPRTCNE